MSSVSPTFAGVSGNVEVQAKSSDGGLQWISMQEIATRNDSGEVLFYADDDYDGQNATRTKFVYNVTKWIKHHPGGSLPILHMRGT